VQPRLDVAGLLFEDLLVLLDGPSQQVLVHAPLRGIRQVAAVDPPQQAPHLEVFRIALQDRLGFLDRVVEPS